MGTKLVTHMGEISVAQKTRTKLRNKAYFQHKLGNGWGGGPA